jgi:hypothetical protein
MSSKVWGDDDKRFAFQSQSQSQIQTQIPITPSKHNESSSSSFLNSEKIPGEESHFHFPTSLGFFMGFHSSLTPV